MESQDVQKTTNRNAPRLASWGTGAEEVGVQLEMERWGPQGCALRVGFIPIPELPARTQPHLPSRHPLFSEAQPQN